MSEGGLERRNLVKDLQAIKDQFAALDKEVARLEAAAGDIQKLKVENESLKRQLSELKNEWVQFSIDERKASEKFFARQVFDAWTLDFEVLAETTAKALKALNKAEGS